MDFDKVLADLREQLKNLNLAIESLERLQNDGRTRPQRGPGVMARKGGRKSAVDSVNGKKHG